MSWKKKNNLKGLSIDKDWREQEFFISKASIHPLLWVTLCLTVSQWPTPFQSNEIHVKPLNSVYEGYSWFLRT